MNKFAKVLISPTGEKFVARSAVEANNLVFGSGYREVDESATDTDAGGDSGGDVEDGTSYAYGGEVTQ